MNVDRRRRLTRALLLVLSRSSPARSTAPTSRRTGHAARPASAITYTKHVAPILQRSCQTCHRPGHECADVADDLRGRAAVGAGHQDARA